NAATKARRHKGARRRTEVNVAAQSLRCHEGKPLPQRHKGARRKAGRSHLHEGTPRWRRNAVTKGLEEVEEEMGFAGLLWDGFLCVACLSTAFLCAAFLCAPLCSWCLRGSVFFFRVKRLSPPAA